MLTSFLLKNKQHLQIPTRTEILKSIFTSTIYICINENDKYIKNTMAIKHSIFFFGGGGGQNHLQYICKIVCAKKIIHMYNFEC